MVHRGEIVFKRWSSEEDQLWITNPDGSDIQSVPNTSRFNLGFYVYNPSWTSDKKILFSGFKDFYNLYKINQEGTELEQLTNNQDDSSGYLYPISSENGNKIAWTDYHMGEEDQRYGNIWIMDGQNQKALTNSTTEDSSYWARSWSSNEEILFQVYDKNNNEIENTSIGFMNTNGDITHWVIENQNKNLVYRASDLSLDGKITGLISEFDYFNYDTFIGDIYGNFQNVTNSFNVTEDFSIFAPDGKSIAYASEKKLYILGIENGRITILSNIDLMFGDWR